MGNTNQNSPLGALPVWLAGGLFLNLAANGYTQVLAEAGVYSGLVINTGGTTSSLGLYDGLSATVTMTIATPGVVTWTAHGLAAGDAVKFTTTGALPTGITAGTTYYVISAGLTANTFRVSATVGGAAINTTGSQSGVHTGWDVTRKIGDFDTTTQGNLPCGTNGALVNDGLIAIAAGGAAADLTVLYR
jgi:hypothetical protein